MHRPYTGQSLLLRMSGVRWHFIAKWCAVLVLVFVGIAHNPSPIYGVWYSLTGQSYNSDLVQDLYGFRALVARGDLYPQFDVMIRGLGLDWGPGLPMASTHPPTAFLFVAPLAFLSWPWASALWGWLMVAVIACSLRLLRVPFRWLPLVLLWPPAAFSLEQLTALWLLGAVLAWRDEKHPFRAGIWIGLASLTKLFPALLLVPFLLQRKYKAAASFGLVWGVALLLVFAIHPAAFAQYVAVNVGNSASVMARFDNGSFVAFAWYSFGWRGIFAELCLLAALALVGRRDVRTFGFVSIALLPISWIHSLLPLLPNFLQAQKSKWTLTAFVLTFLTPPFGGVFRYYSVAIQFCLCIGLMLFALGTRSSISRNSAAMRM